LTINTPHGAFLPHFKGTFLLFSRSLSDLDRSWGLSLNSPADIQDDDGKRIESDLPSRPERLSMKEK